LASTGIGDNPGASVSAVPRPIVTAIRTPRQA
jgi:hypothetical protein